MARLAAFKDRKLDEAALNEKLAGRARMLRSRMASASNEANFTMLGYSKGGLHFGIPIEQVLEVQALDFLTPVPRTPPSIVGVIHWRGVVLTLVDIGRLMQAPETGLADVHVSIILEAAGRRVAVAALEVEDIISVPVSRVRAAPDLAVAFPAEWLRGVCDDRIILNMDAIVQDPRFLQTT